MSRIAAALTLAVLCWFASGKGPVPPFGDLLDPAHGVWTLSRNAEPPASATVMLPRLGADVRVLFDDRAVPHIFAATELDAWRALGYVIARDRLFQLELQGRAGGGTLTELLGAAALPADQEARALGMGRGAERLVKALPDTSEARRVLDGYASGVNAYVEQMRPSELPLEYRLLGRRPAPWTALQSMHVFMRMGYTLAQSGLELRHLAAAARVGTVAADALFPLHAPIQEPIQPSAGEPRTIRTLLPPPGAPDSVAIEALRSVPSAALARAAGDDGNGRGSNNWAVEPARTQDHAALLAGDPHLDLTLPSIWYEAHIVVPGVVDVYGVTIPGIPAVVLGFNRDVAWSFTNTEADVMDRWVEQVDDSLQPAAYRLDGAWAPLELRTEIYRGTHGETLATDTMRFTHRGPLSRIGGRWISTRWTVLESGAGSDALRAAARAHSAAAWLDAMAQFRVPPQNLLVADRSGTIAVRSTGWFPLRADSGRGDRLRDGTTRSSDWIGEWQVKEYPHAVAPIQGFLASANQEPRDPRDAHRYLGADWPAPWRALRINRLLRADSEVTVETMRQWQRDPGSARVERFLPFLLAAAASRGSDTLLAHAARLLAAWDRSYTPDNTGAILFELAMLAVDRRAWDELRPGPSPGSMILSGLLDDSTSAWWDDQRTPGRPEHRDEILSAGLREGYEEAVRRLGPPEGGRWRWSRAHRLDIWHLLHLPSLSALGLSVPGGPYTLSPSSMDGGSEGSSWRMVVELGSSVRGWGTYPGGQSGNPASTRYDDRLPLWLAGELAELRFPRRPEELRARSSLRLTAER
ncbi:MAG TPA: penicillin acylase family protein [Gemmatimonadales bacterium]|nr:penicillin acylase family protein [Gemmatimonadales bacterium]